MTQLLPCPFCGHLHLKPTHHSHFKCEAKACRKWLELPKGGTELQDYEARKAVKQAKSDNWWEAETRRRMAKYGLNYIEARDHIHAEHDRNKQLMAAKAKQVTNTPAPAPQTFTNTTKPIVAMSTTADDDTDAPF